MIHKPDLFYHVWADSRYKPWFLVLGWRAKTAIIGSLVVRNWSNWRSNPLLPNQPVGTGQQGQIKFGKPHQQWSGWWFSHPCSKTKIGPVFTLFQGPKSMQGLHFLRAGSLPSQALSDLIVAYHPGCKRWFILHKTFGCLIIPTIPVDESGIILRNHLFWVRISAFCRLKHQVDQSQKGCINGPSTLAIFATKIIQLRGWMVNVDPNPCPSFCVFFDGSKMLVKTLCS